MTNSEIRDTALVWPDKFVEPGKLHEIKRVNLPLQIIETINESTINRESRKSSGIQHSLFDVWTGDQGQSFETGWKDKLIWGENKYVISSLLENYAGKIDLIYIDPPFATGADFSFRTEIGEEDVTKNPSAIELKVYNDTWGNGLSSYMQMMYDRLSLMREFLTENGSIFVHLDHHVGHYVKVILDEIFGKEHFLDEIIWNKGFRGTESKKGFQRAHENIFWYSKGQNFIWNDVFVDYKDTDMKRYNKVDEKGEKYALIKRRRTDGTVYYGKTYPRDEGKRANDVIDVPVMASTSGERLNYPTQKPEALLNVLIKAASNENSIVADFFSGSGTTLAVAEKLGRRWIGCDISRFAIHTTRKRLLEIENCNPFEILNLGKYERQIWQNTSFSTKDNQTVLYQYLAFILKLYKAQPISGFQFIHGRKGGALVHVGDVDSPVTIDEVNSAISECLDTKQTELHILGWEWEMGLDDLVKVEAKNQGIKLRLLVIPNELIQADIPQKEEINFYDLAYIKAKTNVRHKTVQVELLDFAIPNTELIRQDLKINHWSDLIDYWAVDYDFKKDTFMNKWSCYRTPARTRMSLKSGEYEYKKSGDYAIVLKIVDIFGIDSSRIFEIQI